MLPYVCDGGEIRVEMRGTKLGRFFTSCCVQSIFSSNFSLYSSWYTSISGCLATVSKNFIYLYITSLNKVNFEGVKFFA